MFLIQCSSRALHSAVMAFIGAMGFLASAVLPADAYLVRNPSCFRENELTIEPQHRYGCLIVACSGAFSCIPPLLGWLSSSLNSTAGVGLAIALNISFGAPGQILGVWIYKSDQATRGYPTGHWTNAALLLLVSAGCLGLRLYYGWLNRKPLGQGKVYAY